MRRWQVVTVADAADRPTLVVRAFTNQGAWRKAREIHQRVAYYGTHFTCGDLLPTGCPQGNCGAGGWMEVRRVGDDRTLVEFLNDTWAGL